MLRERLMTAMLAALITLLALAPVGYAAKRRMPAAVATVDLQRLVEEEQQRMAALAGAGGQPAGEQRGRAEKQAMRYAQRLSVVVDALGAECQCVLLNKAALIGGVAADYTDLVRERLGRQP